MLPLASRRCIHPEEQNILLTNDKTNFIEKMIRFSGLAHPKHWKYKIGIAGLVCIAANIAIYDQLFTCTLKEKKLRFKVKNINHTNVVNHFLRVRILYTPFCYLSLTSLAISYGYVEHVYLMWSKYFVRNVIRTRYTHVSGWLSHHGSSHWRLGVVSSRFIAGITMLLYFLQVNSCF